jgi:feruloyl esterase
MMRKGFLVARLGQAIKRLSKHRAHWARLLAAAAPRNHGRAPPSRLSEVAEFGSNPGNLRMLTYVPDGLPPSAPLVVVLHGCTQNAAGYDFGAGWSTLADRYGFALLLPEQRQENNPRGCFNWFRRGDIQRGRGEALSIRQMVERMGRDHAIDPARVFVTGLSAGGAMTAVMLATYPEVFAGGAIIAGLPYGCAGNVQEALDAMFQGQSRSPREWGDLVRAASRHRGPWPKLSVWHGGGDATVVPMNTGEIIKHWSDVHGLAVEPSGEATVDGYPRQVWRDAHGREVIESFTIGGMAHGTPLATAGADAHGAAGPFLLDVGISSTYHIARFWGLTGKGARPAQADVALVAPDGTVEFVRPPRRAHGATAEPQADKRAAAPGTEAPPVAREIHAVIDRALKAAGLK